MPQRRGLAKDLFAIAPIRSETGRAILRDMINLYRQDTEVAFRPDLEPEKCSCAAKRRLKIDMFVPSPNSQAAQALTFILKKEASPAEMGSRIQLLQEETQGEQGIRGVLFCLQ